jgi:hypothetical protein
MLRRGHQACPNAYPMGLIRFSTLKSSPPLLKPVPNPGKPNGKQAK